MLFFSRPREWQKLKYSCLASCLRRRSTVDVGDISKHPSFSIRPFHLLFFLSRRRFCSSSSHFHPIPTTYLLIIIILILVPNYLHLLWTKILFASNSTDSTIRSSLIAQITIQSILPSLAFFHPFILLSPTLFTLAGNWPYDIATV